ncbi:hypothetical protein TGAM01_v207450 [Trichoderma gamsii]|uniref:Uncharacterized protein n=1 Tax=Trichoderma gamsii TaxID=398673 RepID=A0A2P4ZHQ0_9HYPO|nr:hypothetical protein TGAM01_v207450 [Trichoderma gamsii]PON23803.1 hypothetical protein TGAM01_v207450 [Trichoderma gamsii]
MCLDTTLYRRQANRDQLGKHPTRIIKRVNAKKAAALASPA